MSLEPQAAPQAASFPPACTGSPPPPHLPTPCGWRGSGRRHHTGRAAAARHVFLRPRRAAGMAEKVAELRRLPSSAERRQERRGGAGGGAENPPAPAPVPLDSERGLPLLRVKRYYHALGDLVVGAELMGAVESIISENLAAGKIRSYGLRPTDRVLLCGPPGTGKTLTAQVVASALGRPFAYVAFDSLISSYLGETASNMRRVFDYIEGQSMVVLFDEFDSIGKRRDDPHEHGELKRVVNNFMQMLDEYDGGTLIMAATNHHHALDDAVWRRFDEILYFDLPDHARRKALFEKYLRVMRRDDDIDAAALARLTRNYSAADIMQVCVGALRRSIVEDRPSVGRADVVRSLSDQRRRKRANGGAAP